MSRSDELGRTARDVDGQKGEGITGLEGEMFGAGRGWWFTVSGE